MSKRPGEQGQGGGPAKRPFESAPEFLDDGEEYEDEDVFLDDAVDGQAAAQAGLGAGVRPNWRRPPPPQLDPAQHSLGACGVRQRAQAASAAASQSSSRWTWTTLSGRLCCT